MSVGSGEGEPGAFSPWRWALVIVPLAVLVAGAVYLLGVWIPSLEQAYEVWRAPETVRAERPRPPADSGRPSSKGRATDWPPADAAPEAPLNMRAVEVLLANANPEDGAKVFKMCAPCHTAERGGPHRVGPNLWGIIGRPIAADPRFNYSAALRAKRGTWGTAELAAYLNNPRTFAPGTSMAFAGVKNEMRMANLLAYLRALRK